MEEVILKSTAYLFWTNFFLILHALYLKASNFGIVLEECIPAIHRHQLTNINTCKMLFSNLSAPSVLKEKKVNDKNEAKIVWATEDHTDSWYQNRYEVMSLGIRWIGKGITKSETNLALIRRWVWHRRLWEEFQSEKWTMCNWHPKLSGVN